jgi:arsenite methyltransferase
MDTESFHERGVQMNSTAGQSSRDEASQQEPSYFEFQAMFGATKHGGGFRATRELTELCHIDQSAYVLDVGCGVGMTPCDLAKRYGCRVVGVDIRQSMIDRATERARRQGVEHLVEFRVADAQDMPFQEALFDAVIGESVTAFLEDKSRGAAEYVRVTRPGGYVGLNEMTWLKPGPPAELVDYYFHTTGTRPETADAWQQLLKGAGLTVQAATTYKMKMLEEYVDALRRFELRDLLSTGGRFLSLAVTSPAFWRFARAAVPSARVVRAIFEYLGYGIYVSRK